MPTLSAPIAEVTDLMTSRGNLHLFSIDPPYVSVRLLTLSWRNCSRR
jgi:hypothetical protein